jgi:hypothetical protein
MRSELNLFWVTDPLEQQGLPDGRFRVWFRDRTTYIDGAAARATWLARWRERADRIQVMAQRSRSTLVRLDTAASVFDLMRDFLYAKAVAA